MFSVIIVDYNSINKTIKYIDKLKSHCKNEKLIDFIIVENGNEESVRKEVKRFCRRKFYVGKYAVSYYKTAGLSFNIVFPGSNLGYAKGNNVGYCVERIIYKNQYILISNNDLTFDKLLDLEYIVSIFESNKQIGIIGPKIIGTDATRQSPYIVDNPFDRLILYYWKSVLNFKNINKVDNNIKEGYCDYVSGSFVFINTNAFKIIDGYDPQTFLYGEEIILSARMKKKNYRTYFTSKLEVMHNQSQTVKSNVKILSILKYGFQSAKYYYENYQKVSKYLIILADINFSLFEFLYRIKHKLKEN